MDAATLESWWAPTPLEVVVPPDLTVLLVGNGPERVPLEALAHELGIAPNVRLLGFREDVSDVLRALDVAVSCSDFEGSPLAVMEYMDAGLPIVATAVGGVPDLIDDGGTLVACHAVDERRLPRASGMLRAG